MSLHDPHQAPDNAVIHQRITAGLIVEAAEMRQTQTRVQLHGRIGDVSVQRRDHNGNAARVDDSSSALVVTRRERSQRGAAIQLDSHKLLPRFHHERDSRQHVGGNHHRLHSQRQLTRSSRCAVGTTALRCTHLKRRLYCKVAQGSHRVFNDTCVVGVHLQRLQHRCNASRAATLHLQHWAAYLQHGSQHLFRGNVDATVGIVGQRTDGATPVLLDSRRVHMLRHSS
jgi:hypothetical protein